ncbi:MAG TPA: GGDEF domain-containing protein [Candidatus Elarobacter sp.]|nr:GGDEF domain-containing protein [Candidatus Elarobacter sp.]
MPMGSNRFRFSGSPRKRSNVKNENDASDVAILNVAVDSESLFRRRVPGSLSGKRNRAVDDVFHTLLSEANRELASLLQDVRTKAGGTSLGDARSQQVSELLIRAVRCAAKQYTLQAELGNLALTDELTGLYNRRGFMALAERQLKLARRSGRGMLLFMMDVDHLKQINDTLGHLEGDCALERTAEVLEETFRDSDVVARLGGDEFAVLAVEAAGHCEATIRARLFELLKSISAKQSRYSISLSMGVARFDPDSPASIADLMMKADQAMYEQKRQRLASCFETEISSRSQ